MSKKALVMGATGLIGNALVRLLSERDYYEEIVVLTRREIDLPYDKLKVLLVKDFDNLDEYKDHFNVHDVYCAIGSTIKKAGSKENFLKIDVEYPIILAMLTMYQSNFQQFLVVTSFGAKANSPMFYNRSKGKLEVALERLNMKSLSIFQPTLLIGKREEFRPLEKFAKAVSAFLSFFVIGAENRIWSIHAYQVAEAMFQVARLKKEGMKRYNPNKMLEIIYQK